MKLLINILGLDNSDKCSKIINEMFSDISFNIDNEAYKLEIDGDIISDIQRGNFKRYISDKIKDIINETLGKPYDINVSDNVSNVLLNIKNDVYEYREKIMSVLKDYEFEYIYFIDDDLKKPKKKTVKLETMFDDNFWYIIHEIVDVKISEVIETINSDINKLMLKVK